MPRTRTEAPKHKTKLVRNQSQRRGPILAIIVHSTESSDIPDSQRDLDGVESWFDNPISDASSHIGVDGDANTRVWVHSDRKAWTAGAANGWSLNIEFIARAAQAKSAWESEQIKEGAKWAAYWGAKYNIPATLGKVRNVNGLCVCTKRGVLRHSDITAAGFGSHSDPGRNFPMDDFLKAMRYYRRYGWVV